MNEFSKFARYNINIQKSIVFLYSSNKQVKIKIKKNNYIYYGIKNFLKEFNRNMKHTLKLQDIV